MAIVKVKSINDIPRLRSFNVQSSNKLYFQANGYVVKIFLECYQKLDEKIGRDILEVLTKLMGLENKKSLILPHDIYVTDDDILGYSTKFINAPSIDFISRDTNIRELLESYRNLLESIKELASNSINLFDIHKGNILYKNSNLYLLDFDLSELNNSFDENKIYIEMAYKIWQTILRSIFKDLGEYSLYEILNYLRIRDFNRAALGCGIISVTDSLDEFYISLQKSLLVDDKSCLKDIDIVLRRINNGY